MHIKAKPGLWLLFRIWANIGLQSFGGGASTTLLIQREFIEKRGWLTIEEFARLWNLSIFTPGINLVALTVLIGRKLGGVWGIVVSVTGLLLPSATITCLLAAGFKLIQHTPAVQAILRGVIPATGGIMLLVGLNFARPLIVNAYKEGIIRLLISIVVIALCALAIIALKVPVIIVVPAAALLGVIIFTPRRIAGAKDESQGEQHD
jgi:chromate transporter